MCDSLILKVNRLLAGTLAIVMITSLILPSYGQLVTTAIEPIPGPGVVARITQTNGQECVVIDFEGVGNQAPVGTIPTPLGDAEFSANALGLVDNDAGGTGPFANEPSPDTVIFVFTDPDPIITMTLENPAEEVSWFYSSPQASTVRIFDVNDDLITEINQAGTPPGPGDPTGGIFGTWVGDDFNAGANVIKKVEFDGTLNSIIWDNIDFCQAEVVGGELLPIDSTALLLAGAQTFSWMIPVVLSVLGIGLFVFRKPENS